MSKLMTVAVSRCLAVAAGGVRARDTMKKDAMKKDCSDTACHSQAVDEATNGLSSDLTCGLGVTDAERLTACGPNALAKARQRSALTILFHQFRSRIVGLPIAAGGVSLVLG